MSATLFFQWDCALATVFGRKWQLLEENFLYQHDLNGEQVKWNQRWEEDKEGEMMGRFGEKCSKSHLHPGRGHGVPLILDFSCLVTWSYRRYRDDTRLVCLFDCCWCQAFSFQAPLPPRSDISNRCWKICFDNQQLPDPDPISYVTRVLADNYMSLFLAGGNTRNSRHCCWHFTLKYLEIFRTHWHLTQEPSTLHSRHKSVSNHN